MPANTYYIYKMSKNITFMHITHLESFSAKLRVCNYNLKNILVSALSLSRKFPTQGKVRVKELKIKDAFEGQFCLFWQPVKVISLHLD